MDGTSGNCREGGDMAPRVDAAAGLALSVACQRLPRQAAGLRLLARRTGPAGDGG